MNKNTKKLTFNILVCLLLAGALLWVASHFFHFGRVEFTDNAQVKQLIVPVNSRIQGFVKKIYFTEFQYVKKGDTLATIEDMEFRFRLAQAEADYDRATSGKEVMSATINTTTNNISVNDAAIQEASALMENARKEYERYEKLYAQESVTKQEFDAKKTDYEAKKARFDQINRQKESSSLVRKEQTKRLGQNEAEIKLADAALELARLNLSYTVILAPCDGYTGRKNIQEGQLIQPGQTIVDLVDENDKWIVANFKETQTHHIAEGQDVEIEVDALPGVTFQGKVQAISKATGNSFSLIPHDYSTGNFVKVEQRIPIRIDFSDQNDVEALKRVSAGMNAECTVKY